MALVGDGPVDRAWQLIAAELTQQYPGWTVTYQWLGFTAERDGVTLGPIGWKGIIALLDVQPAVSAGRASS